MHTEKDTHSYSAALMKPSGFAALMQRLKPVLRPRGILGWMRTAVIGALGVLMLTSVHYLHEEAELVYSIHRMRAALPDCTTFKVQSEKDGLFLLDCNGALEEEALSSTQQG